MNYLQKIWQLLHRTHHEQIEITLHLIHYRTGCPNVGMLYRKGVIQQRGSYT